LAKDIQRPATKLKREHRSRINLQSLSQGRAAAHWGHCRAGQLFRCYHARGCIESYTCGGACFCQSCCCRVRGVTPHVAKVGGCRDGVCYRTCAKRCREPFGRCGPNIDRIHDCRVQVCVQCDAVNLLAGGGDHVHCELGEQVRGKARVRHLVRKVLVYYCSLAPPHTGWTPLNIWVMLASNGARGRPIPLTSSTQPSGHLACPTNLYGVTRCQRNDSADDGP
jgi:hypothetical protein